MPLNPGNLESNLLSLISSFPATAELAANGIANAYHSYAALGQSCAGLTPTLVNLPGLKSELKTTLEDDTQDAGDSAEAWKDGLVTYWTGALFGPTGIVTIPIIGAPAFKSGLEALFIAQAATVTPFPTSANALATLIDTFTKTVVVTDAGFPCGPAPIT